MSKKDKLIQILNESYNFNRLSYLIKNMSKKDQFKLAPSSGGGNMMKMVNPANLSALFQSNTPTSGSNDVKEDSSKKDLVAPGDC